MPKTTVLQQAKAELTERKAELIHTYNRLGAEYAKTEALREELRMARLTISRLREEYATLLLGTTHIHSL